MFHRRLHRLTLLGESQPELEFYKLGVDGRLEEIKGTSPLSDTARLQGRSLDKDPFEDLRKQWRGQTKVQEPVTIQFKENDLTFKVSNLHDAGPPERINRPFQDTGRIVFWTSHAKIVAHRRYNSDRVYVEIIGNDIVLKDASGPFQEMARMKNLFDFIVISRHCRPEKASETEFLNLLVVKWSEV